VGAKLDFNAWEFWRSASADEQRAQLEYQQTLADGSAQLDDGCFVSQLAACYPDELVMGERSYIAAHAYVTGSVRMGANCTVNANAVVRGTVTAGDGVRIGAHTSILGFNHGMEPDQPVFRQQVTSAGIVIGDDVWIGSNVVVVDGVTIGAHSVIGAGSVVTRDVPEWSVMAGNPARRLRDRREQRSAGSAAAADELPRRLERFAAVARRDARHTLTRCWDDHTGQFVDRPGQPATVRALCDAVEIADLLVGGPPEPLSGDEIVGRLRGWQDPVSGLVAPLDSGTVVQDGHDLAGGQTRYHILSAGYALELLGSSFTKPIAAVDTITPAELGPVMDGLPWTERAWSAGDWIDSYATGLYWNRRWFGLPGSLDTLIGWLHTHVEPTTGMWGELTPLEGRRQMVNGFYRLTRGSFAQFGLPIPYPREVIDTVLTHTRDPRWFGDGRGNACDVLDVIHPLWLAGAQTGHRRDAVRAWATAQLERVLPQWRPGAGFSFGLVAGPGFDGEPGLQGTEMWLAIIWYLADVVGCSHALGYVPRGVHRPTARQ
jgi:acetyltransferase-like isoleucine patch superfamily enzyme